MARPNPTRSGALLGLGVRNLRAQAGLVGATVLIAALVVALTSAVPLFARSVSGELFALRTDGANRAETRISWNGSVHGATTWSVLGEVDAQLRGQVDKGLILPEGDVRSLVDSVRLQVRLGEASVGSTSLSWHDDLDQLIRLGEGRMPSDTIRFPGGRIEVLVEEQTAAAQGLGVGDRIDLRIRGVEEFPIAATVVGTWAANDATGWVTAPAGLTDRYFTSRPVLERFFDVGGGSAELVRSGRWLVSSSAADITTEQARAVRDEANALTRTATRIAPELEADTALADQLDGFIADAASMRRQMAVVMGPVLVALTFFTVLLGRQRAAVRRREFDLWRLRGADDRQVSTVVVGEALVMAVLAMLLGLLIAPALSLLLGSFDGFLDLSSDRVGRPLIGTAPSVAAAAAAATVVLVALLAASLPLRRELVLSLASIGAAAVGLLAVLLASAPADTQGFRNPAPFVVPVLVAALAVGLGHLVLGRSLGPLKRRLTESTSAATALGLAVRRLGGSRWMIGPAALLAIGLAVALTSAAVGRSTDEHLDAMARHAVGADWSLQETLAVRLLGGGDGGLRSEPMSTDEWAAIDGVTAASRVGTWTGSVGPPGRSSTDMTLLAVEPETFATVGWWRDDYAPTSLPTLLAALTDTGGVLVNAASGLRVGDTAELRVFTGTDSRTIDAPVVGRITRAPTWDPSHTPAVVVADLQVVLAALEQDRGFQVWLETTGDAGIEESARDAAFLTSIESSGQRIDAARRDPIRRGVYGVFSFATVILLGLGLVGALVASSFADRARAGERSLLRALGFTPSSLGGAAVWEAALLLVPAIAGGVGVGVFITRTLLGRLIDVGAGVPPLRLLSDLRLLPAFLLGVLLTGLAVHRMVAGRAAAPIDLHSFVNEGEG